MKLDNSIKLLYCLWILTVPEQIPPIHTIDHAISVSIDWHPNPIMCILCYSEFRAILP